MSDYGIKSQSIPRGPKLWTPDPGCNPQLDEFCDSITNHTARIPFKSAHDNLPPGERAALKSLSKHINEDIVIRPADKGGALSIQNTQDYITSCNSLLSDNQFYEPFIYLFIYLFIYYASVGISIYNLFGSQQ